MDDIKWQMEKIPNHNESQTFNIVHLTSEF